MELSRLPFFDRLSEAKTVLLAGAGGGFDIFTGLPLYFALQAQGKTVHLANLSFSTIYATNGRKLGPSLVEVRATTKGELRYFPERLLCQWFQKERNENRPLFCIERTGASLVTTAYRNLVAHLGGVDAVVLIDGGTDSLMRGDESGLGTPQEDLASIIAVDALADVPIKLLVSLGFGIDAFHEVCHVHWLESVAALTKSGHFLGAWSLQKEMDEARLYGEAIEFVHSAMFNHPSIVNASILSAIDGEFGDFHTTCRTEGTELFINPLMSLYWAFDLVGVVKRHLFLDELRDTVTFTELTAAISRAWGRQTRREWRPIPH